MQRSTTVTLPLACREETDDTCQVESLQACGEPIDTTSDALCECGIAGISSPPPSNDDIVRQNWRGILAKYMAGDAMEDIGKELKAAS